MYLINLHLVSSANNILLIGVALVVFIVFLLTVSVLLNSIKKV